VVVVRSTVFQNQCIIVHLPNQKALISNYNVLCDYASSLILTFLSHIPNIITIAAKGRMRVARSRNKAHYTSLILYIHFQIKGGWSWGWREVLGWVSVLNWIYLFVI
jgi:hypothetical protein